MNFIKLKIKKKYPNNEDKYVDGNHTILRSIKTKKPYGICTI